MYRVRRVGLINIAYVSIVNKGTKVKFIFRIDADFGVLLSF